MAKQKRIKAVIQFRRGEAARWAEVNPILRPGEPGYELDEGGLKIGDGVTHWNDLPYEGGKGGGDLPILIEDPTDGQVLLYNAESGKWENYDLADENSIIYLGDKGLSLKGYEEANQGQMLVKDEQLGLAWVDPVSDASLQEAVQAANDAATRSSTSAIQAGNFAGQAAQSAAAVERKFWYGTMEEYNNLETIYPSTIYVILHE